VACSSDDESRRSCWRGRSLSWYWPPCAVTSFTATRSRGEFAHEAPGHSPRARGRCTRSCTGSRRREPSRRRGAQARADHAAATIDW